MLINGWKVISIDITFQRSHNSLQRVNNFFDQKLTLNVLKRLIFGSWTGCGVGDCEALTEFLIWRDTCYLGVPASLQISHTLLFKVGEMPRWSFESFRKFPSFFLSRALAPPVVPSLRSHFCQISHHWCYSVNATQSSSGKLIQLKQHTSKQTSWSLKNDHLYTWEPIANMLRH